MINNDDTHYKTSVPEYSDAIAIIGMAGRFPGAQTIDEFWGNIVNGVESIRFFSDEELLAAGVSKDDVNNPKYVKGRGYLEDAEYFDASFFNISPRDAQIIDPQQRLFLECAWESLENAAYVPETYDGIIGVFAGAGYDFYQIKNLMLNLNVCRNLSDFQLIISNDKDYLSTRTSYKLNLKGPSIVIQSACSTSLVAVQLACQSLLNYQCDIALSGGVSIQVPRICGYEYTESHILSPDGHCRAFDEKASGTNFGDGVGVVVLKRLEEAIQDHDHIYAVIRSIAVNNDGADKIGYTAPSINGQADVIQLAHSFAGTTPDMISYIEAHGTGTPIGDPIEIAGLKKAFELSNRPGKYCAIGSVKSNIGHLDVAAGVTGLLKTALALYNKTIPVSINFNKPNPKLEIENSPFYVNTQSRPWESLLDDNGNEIPRRAGISSFGMGGTNAHGILEEMPHIESILSNNHSFILPFSAKSQGSLNTYTLKLSEYFEKNKTISLADAAYTLQIGRKAFDQRRYVISTNLESATANLNNLPLIITGSGKSPKDIQSPVFMFTGQGSQYIGMGKNLYKSNNVFKKYIDICSENVRSILSIDLRDIIFSDNKDDKISDLLKQTSITQPALFSIEYALAQTWLSIGVQPVALVGHSIGEYTAACLSGVMSLEDAIFLVCNRGRLMQSMPAGSMLSVNLPEKELQEYLNGGLSIGVINSASICVISGENKEIDALEMTLTQKNIPNRRLHTSHAFHSKMMEPILDEFINVMKNVIFNEPKIPFVSNVTGTWIKTSEATNPNYWANHLRHTVRFADCLTSLIASGCNLFLEVGPGNTLASLARQNAMATSIEITSIPSLPHPKQDIHDYDFWLSAIGNLWINNVSIDWKAIYGDEERRRIPMPTYAFDRQKYWIDPDTKLSQLASSSGLSASSYNVTVDTVTTEEEIPSTQTEEDIIKSIWQTLLGIKSIGNNDNFFDLGGESIWGAQVINRINKHFSVKLPQNAIFNSPTISELVNILKNEGFQAGEVKTTAYKEENENRRIPLSLSQKRLWFLHKLDPESPALNLTISFEITGNLQIDYLERSIQNIINRHEILRSTFLDIDGVPEVRIIDNLAFKLEYINYDQFLPEEAKKALAKSVRDINRIPHDLHEGPLFRLVLYKVTENRYILVLMIHHIIFDGWSMSVFMKELGAFYEITVKGSEPDLPPLTIQYSDYAEWQNSQTETNNLIKSKEFWTQTLSGIPHAIDFPYDHPRSPIPKNLGGMINFSINENLFEKLKNTCQQERVTLFTFLLTVFKVLLYRYSGQKDLVVGSPVANRTRLDDEKLIGLFINMIVLRSDLNGDPQFSELLNREHDSFIKAMSHSEYPFERIVTDLQLTRDMSIHPIYQVMFALQNFEIPAIDINEISIRNVVLDRGASQLDIWLFMWAHDKQLAGAFEYDSDLFDESTVQGMIDHYICLLESVVKDPSQSIDKIPIMTSEELDKVLHNYNLTDHPYDNKTTVIDIFEKQAMATPDSTAIIYNREKFTYRELNMKSNQIAQYLKGNGIVVESFVGIHLHRGINMVATVLGVMKAGGVYLPLDPEFPDDRLRFMIEDSKVSMIISESDISGTFKNTTCPVVEIEVLFKDSSGFVDSNPNPELKPENLAYIIYTSGSTGKPKGVQIPHRALTNFLFSMKREPGITATDNLLAVTTLSFDISCLEIFLPLISGATITIASHEDVRDGARLIELLKSGNITTMQATPATWRLMIESGLKSLSGIKVLCGGEVLPRDLARDILDLGGELWNMYGPTETTIWSAVNSITSTDKQPPIGIPIDNTTFYILDSNLKPVPVGVPGELFIGGDGLARGYLNRPELTEERFIFHSFDGKTEQRLYKTGDLVRRLPDETIDYISRIDSQVKLRGYRIELGEIEAQLNLHEAIKESVVIIHEDINGDKRLVAYYVTQNKDIVDDELKAFLRKTLPDYMIPSHFMNIESLPLTPNGKIDRKALQKIEPVLLYQSKKSEPPRDNLEKQLANIWEDVLGVNHISVYDNFFDIGGDSLIAARLFAVISKQLGITLPLALLFQHPTIADIADSIRSGEYKSNWSSLVPIRVEGDKPGLFLVHGAEGNVIIYRDLANCLPDDIPVYGLQSSGLQNIDYADITIEKMATHYIEEIKSVQPLGPYHLGGYCLGGSIVFEMAQQLYANGDKVGLVILIESYNVATIDYPGPLYIRKIESFQNLWFHLLNIAFSPDNNGRWKFFLTKLKTEQKRFSSNLRMLFSTFLSKLQIQEKKMYPHIEITKLNHHAQIKYIPESYPGKILLLRPKKYFFSAKDSYYGWKDVVTGGIDVVELDVNPHGSLTEPYVREVGVIIMKYINDYVKIKHL